MKLIIRDDDVSYFTSPKILENLYEDVWDKCPISLSVVPFILSTPGQLETPIKFRHTKKLYPIGENKELVNFLKKKIKEGKGNLPSAFWNGLKSNLQGGPKKNMSSLIYVLRKPQ